MENETEWKQTDRQTDKQIDRQADRQRAKENFFQCKNNY